MHAVLYFFIAIGILVFLHEFGHFIAAVLAGVRVETFSIGFGPKLLRFRLARTEFAVSAVPLGGYVKMSGEDPEKPSLAPYDFYAKSPQRRILIALAGPFMNLLTAFLFFALAFQMGRYLPSYQVERPVVGKVLSEGVPLEPGDVILAIDGKPIKDWAEFSRIVAVNPGARLRVTVERDSRRLEVSVDVGTTDDGLGSVPVLPAVKPIVGRVIKGSPAERAGFEPGDVILSINGKRIKVWDDVVSTIGNSKGAPVVVRVLRNGRELSITAQPEFNRKLGRFTVGIVPEVKLVFVRYEGFDAVKRGAREFLLQSETFFSFLGKLLSGSASVRSLGGPIAIAEIAGKAGSAGLSNFVYFLGFISLQLGYFNLFPLPVLDGGLILMFLFELLKGGAVSPKLRERFQQVGFVLIALVMALVFYNDILRLLGSLGR